jgi:hemolysin III
LGSISRIRTAPSPRPHASPRSASGIAQGWVILFALDPLVEAVPSHSVMLLLAGGVIYTAGVAFHLLERLPYHNAIWHLFVLGGAVSQFASIYSAVFP